MNCGKDMIVRESGSLVSPVGFTSIGVDVRIKAMFLGLRTVLKICTEQATFPLNKIGKHRYCMVWLEVSTPVFH